MRLVLRIDSNPLSLLPAAASVALALSALPADASAQKSIGAAQTVSSAQQTTESAAAPTSNAAANTAAIDDTNNAQVLNVPADGAASSEVALDDRILSRQRGSATGMVRIATTPQLMPRASVTLWDEIAPPSPLPVPIDAARAAQGNVANYQRK